MTQVKFNDSVDDSLLKFAVIIAKSNGKWVFCKHIERDTYECQEVTEKQEKPLMIQPSVNYTKKPEQ